MNDTPPVGALPLAAGSIDHDEGFVPHAYWDALGRVWTIGSGLTRLNGAPVTMHTLPITEAQNDAAVASELAATATLIGRVVQVALSPCEWAALANFAFNVGGHAFSTSTMLRKLNAGDKAGAGAQFLVWVLCDGKVVEGLRNRRIRTEALFAGQNVPGVTDRPGMPSAAVRRAVPSTAKETA